MPRRKNCGLLTTGLVPSQAQVVVNEKLDNVKMESHKITVTVNNTYLHVCVVLG